MLEVDIQDIQASLNGDEAGFARLVARYESQVYAQMWRFTRDRRVLDELVQDVFVEVYLSLCTFRGDAPFLHWIRRIATRVGYRFWKQECADRQRRESLTQQSALMRCNPVQEPSEASETLYRILEYLGPRDRLVLTLYYFEGCNAKEISRRTGWNLSLVRVQKYRACRRLKRMLTNAGYGRTGHG